MSEDVMKLSVMIIVVLSILFIICRLDYLNKEIKSEAISRGVAQHNPITGEWEWTIPVREKP